MSSAQSIVPCEVGGVAAEDDSVACLAWANGEWLEEFGLHGDIVLQIRVRSQ